MKTLTASAIVRSVLSSVLLTTNIACGSVGTVTAPSSSDAANSRPNGPGPTPTASTIVPASTEGVPGLYRTDVIMSRSGTATITLQWPDGDYSLQLYVTSGTCLELTALLGERCTIVGKTRPGDRPGVVAGPVTSGDMNTIWVLNPDSAPQPITVLTKIE